MIYDKDLEKAIKAWVKTQVKEKRIPHVKGVVKTAGKLAKQYAPEEIMRCRIAGWLHDAAKHWPDDALLAYAEAHGEAISESERTVPMLLHGVVGYLIGAAQFGLDDPALKSACTNHTTGAPDMGIVDKIVFLADLIEPGRDFPAVDAIRTEAAHDLDAAVLLAVDHTLTYLIDHNKIIDPRPILLRNTLISQGVSYVRPT